MNLKLKLHLFLFLALAIAVGIKCASASDQILKFEVNLKPNIALKKNLVSIASEMEKTAKLYKTTNQKVYWENELKKTFAKLLYSYGYYSSNIDVDIKETSDTIIFNIETFNRYAVSSVIIKYDENSNDNIKIPDINKLKTKKNHFVFAKDVIDDQEWLLKNIEKNNCLLSLSISHQAIVNHSEESVEIIFLVSAGPTATIEKVEFKGLSSVKPEYARKLVKLTNGQCFKRSYVNESRGNLQKSNLFSSTTPKIPKTVNADGSVPIVFNITERKARSLKSGINYGTDTGLGLVFGWEHRNFFGSGEEVKVNLTGNKKEQIVELNYEKPFFRRDDQTLRLENSYESKKTKAFDSKEAAISALIDRQLTPEWKAGAGIRFSYASIDKIEGVNNKQAHYLFSTPLYIGKDTRSNILDPTKGYNIVLDTSPFVRIDTTKKPFLKTTLTGSSYFTHKSKGKLTTTLALKAAIGTISGINSKDIPNTEKFYVGGSNSVRGYAYQFAGNLDANKRPLGGKSSIETAIELRLKFANNIGVVGFIDSGYAYDELNVNKKQKLLHGIGIGARYITSFGPLRADIGFPLKRRKFIDKTFQLYFGIGQAF